MRRVKAELRQDRSAWFCYARQTHQNAGLAMAVSLRNPTTGDIKVLDEGWSWGCFLGCFFLGLPLYRRGLQIWGSVMLAFNVVMLVIGLTETDHAESVYGWMSVIGFGLAAFFGLRANAMAIERYRALGWEPVASRFRF